MAVFYGAAEQFPKVRVTLLTLTQLVWAIPPFRLRVLLSIISEPGTSRGFRAGRNIHVGESSPPPTLVGHRTGLTASTRPNGHQCQIHIPPPPSGSSCFAYSMHCRWYRVNLERDSPFHS